MSALRRVAGALLAVVAVGAVGWGSRAPMEGGLSADEGLIRLSWRLRAEGDGTDCVPPTPEELEALPVHMRNPDACMGRGLAFHLEVSLDGTAVASDTLEPSGARGDRPIFVLRDLPVTAGSHDISVRFEPIGAGAGDALTLEERVHVDSRSILLVTYDPVSERFVMRERSEP